jgi:hypothetical protein
VNNERQTFRKIGLHTIAVYLAMFVSVILAMLTTLIIPGAGQASTLIGRTLEPPLWLPQVICGGLAGWIVKRRFGIGDGGFGILIPLLLLLLSIFTEGLEMRPYTPLADIYFSADSGATEGLYKLIFTAPLYTAIAYCLGALASKTVSTNSQV